MTMVDPRRTFAVLYLYLFQTKAFHSGGGDEGGLAATAVK